MALTKSLLLVALVVAAAFAGRAEAQTCFVRNCQTCSVRNPYICAVCGGGGAYVLTAAKGCNYCAVGYEQNMDAPTFTCTKCQAGYTSPGGVGPASACVKITANSGRRLFADADEDLWA